MVGECIVKFLCPAAAAVKYFDFNEKNLGISEIRTRYLKILPDCITPSFKTGTIVFLKLFQVPVMSHHVIVLSCNTKQDWLEQYCMRALFMQFEFTSYLFSWIALYNNVTNVNEY